MKDELRLLSTMVTVGTFREFAVTITLVTMTQPVRHEPAEAIHVQASLEVEATHFRANIMQGFVCP